MGTFHKLTPRTDVELGVYRNALSFVFANDDIRNIAITGTYGAGKTTIIQSYQNATKQEYVYVSLAPFEKNSELTKHEDSKNNKTNENSNHDIQKLEKKVINQLIHSICPKKVPRTSFRIKKDVSRRHRIRVTLLVAVISLLTFYLVKFDNLSRYLATINPEDTCFFCVLSHFTKPRARIHSTITLAVLLIWVLYFGVSFLTSNKVLAKLSMWGNDLEIFTDDHDSEFDKYLDEILYLIENSGSNVFVFEDIDRFQEPQIFIRLREINRLVNARCSSNGKKGRIIRFFYMIRDDLFKSDDRAKFFDFIITVIPVTVATNSYEHLVEMLEKSNLREQFDDYFLRDISLFIDDMRILKNIVNEYQIYYKQLENSPELDPNKLLGIMFYKNLYPHDFVKLQQGVGQVHDLFSAKKNKLVKEQIKAVAKRALASIELDEEFQSVLEAAVTTESIDIIDSIMSLLNHEEVSLDIMKQLEGLLNEINEIKTKKLHELIDESNESGVLDGLKPIERYLIRQGYLDGTYADYLSYYLGQSYSPRDYQFLRRVVDRRAATFEYSIDQPDKVLASLNPAYFYKPVTLNNNLLDYILQHAHEYTEQQENIIRQIRREKRVDFIQQYLERGKSIIAFIMEINHSWPQVWTEILESERFTPGQLHKYLRYTLIYSPIDVITSLNIDNALADFISGCDYFLSLDDLNEEHITTIVNHLSALGIKFHNIAFEEANKQLFSVVYEADLYRLNREMISLILRVCYKIDIDAVDDFQHRNYTLIISNTEQPLAKYVDRNIEEYLNWYLVISESKITDSEEAVIMLLNHPNISHDSKNRYIESLVTVVENITSISDEELWPILLEHGLVKGSEENILQYYFGYANVFDDYLIDFINNHTGDLNFDYDEIAQRFGEDKQSEWVYYLVSCNSLINEKYKRILESLKFTYTEFTIEGIENDKIVILLNQNKIMMSDSNVEFMRESYPQNFIEFIRLNIGKYVEDVASDVPLEYDEILEMILTDISDEHKIAFINMTDNSISIRDRALSPVVQKYILENNYDENDMPYLVEDFETLHPIIQDVFEKICAERINVLIENNYVLPFALLRELLRYRFDLRMKQKLLAGSFDPLSIEQAVEILSLAGLSKLIRAFKGGRPGLPRTEDVRRILHICERNKWISSVSETGNYYIANGWQKEPPLKA